MDLTHNHLTELPSSLQDLHHLGMTHLFVDLIFTKNNTLSITEIFYVRHNKLAKIPKLRNCTNLKELHLGNNCITEVTSEDIENIPNVRQLDLRDNKISSIPNEITGEDNYSHGILD